MHIVLNLVRSISGFGITFGMETRANDVAKPFLRALRDAGLTRLLLGIESGNQRVLKRLDKRTTVTDNERAIAITRDAGIEPEIGFIMFDPASVIEDVRENFSFLDRNNLLDRLGRTANLLYHGQVVFKGTPGYRLAAERGVLAPDGPFGFKGRLLYEDLRVGWLSGMMRPICQQILRQMEELGSPIHWRAEETGNEYHRTLNDLLVHIFQKMLDTAARLTSQPEAAWTRAQLTVALDEIDQALSGI